MESNASEISKWPSHVTNSDVIVRDPRTGATGEWPVTGGPQYVNGCTVITCELEDGGERVLVYQPTQRADVRNGVTYTAVPRLTRNEREQALETMICNEGELKRFAAVAIAGWPEIFDAAYARVERHRDHAKKAARRPA